MRKLIILLSITLLLLSCKKEDNTKEKDYEVTISSRISKDKYYEADSSKFEFYKSSSDSIPFFVAYSGIDGKVKVTLKGDTEYWAKCITASFKSSTKKNTYHYFKSYPFHSTRENAGTKPNDHQVIFNFGKDWQTDGKGSTVNVYVDPVERQ